jgi:hypothetical protein
MYIESKPENGNKHNNAPKASVYAALGACFFSREFNMSLRILF